MPGHVCEKHERYVHEGEECPYCPSDTGAWLTMWKSGPAATSYSYKFMVPPSSDLLEAMKRAWAEAAAQGKP
jgi:hypothetical protein